MTGEWKAIKATKFSSFDGQTLSAQPGVQPGVKYSLELSDDNDRTLRMEYTERGIIYNYYDPEKNIRVNFFHQSFPTGNGQEDYIPYGLQQITFPYKGLYGGRTITQQDSPDTIGEWETYFARTFADITIREVLSLSQPK